MTKDLSRQLCELIPIQPKYIGYRWDFEDRDHFIRSKTFDSRLEAEKYNSETEFQIKELNVDFETPENFVKLFNVITKTGFWTWDYSSYARSIENSSDFIYEVQKWLEEINSDEDWQEFFKVTKQALQATDFKY